MVLDPAHGAFVLLVLPRAQRGSGLVPRSQCRFHHRASRDAAVIGNGFADPISFSFPSPTPIPRLTLSPAQVLTTFCDAIDQQDLGTAWAQYTKALQKGRAEPPPFLVRITIVHCRVDDVSDTSATGYLLLKTIGPTGYADDYDRPLLLRWVSAGYDLHRAIAGGRCQRER